MRLRWLFTVGVVILLCGHIAKAGTRKDLPTSSAGSLNSCANANGNPTIPLLYLNGPVVSLTPVTVEDGSGNSYAVHVDIYDWGTLECPSTDEDRTSGTYSIYFVYVLEPDGQTLSQVDFNSLEISLPLNNPNFLVCGSEQWALCNAPVDGDEFSTPLQVLQPAPSPGSDGKSTVWSFSIPYNLASNPAVPVPLNSNYGTLDIESNQSYNIGYGAAVLVTDGAVQCTPAAAQCNSLAATTPYGLIFTPTGGSAITAATSSFVPLNPAPASAAAYETSQSPKVISGSSFSGVYNASQNTPQDVEGTPSTALTYNCSSISTSPVEQYRSVWFEYTSPVNTMVFASTAGSHYDTVLSVTGTPSGGTPVSMCNDDFDPTSSSMPNGIGLVTSQLTFAASAGTPYLFLVTEYPPEQVELDAAPYTASMSGDSTLYFTLSTPQINVSPGSLSNFGTETVGKTTAAQTVTIASNTLNFGATGVTGITATATGDFQVSPSSCATPLADGGPACTLSVTFTPSLVGSRNGTLTISSSGTLAAENAPLVLALLGSGMESPMVTVTPASSSITMAQSLKVTVTVSGGTGNPTPTGAVVLEGGGYTSQATTLASGSATINIPAGSLAIGSDTLTVTYTPDSASSADYAAAVVTSSAVTVSQTKITPTVTLTPGSSSITTAQPLSVMVAVSGGSGNPTPTGTVTLTSGSYSSAATALTSGSTTTNVPAGSLAVGSDTLTASYAPDSNSSSTYNTATGTSSAVTVTQAKTTPAVTVSPSASSITTAQPLSLTVAVSGGSGNPTPTGSVTLTSGSYTSAATTLSSGSATINIAAGSLAVGSDILAASYTPDSNSSSAYNSATGTSSAVTVTVAIGTANSTLTVTPSAATITNQQTDTVTVSVAGSSGQATPTGTVTLASGSYNAQQALAAGTASFTIAAGALSSGANMLTATYSGDATYAGSSGTASVTVSPVVITVSAPSPVSPGASTTGTVTLATSTTYSGTLNVTCTLAGSPTGAQSLPTCGLNPASVTVTPGGTGSTVFTAYTTAASSTALARPSRVNLWGIGGGGALLAVALFFGVPSRRRRWISMLALLSVALAGWSIGCGGGGPQPIGTNTPATTAGSYTFTVAGTDSGNSKITTSATVSITVQ